MDSRTLRSMLAAVVVAAVTAVVPAAAEFQAATVISAPDASQQDVAMNANGDAVVVWQHYRPAIGKGEIKGRRRSADGSWGPVETLSNAAPDTNDPQVALDKGGTAYVVWDATSSNGTRHRVFGRVWPAGGAPGAIFGLSNEDGRGDSPDVAAGDYAAIAVWRKSFYVSGVGVVTRIQTRPLAGSGGGGNLSGPSAHSGGAIAPATDPHVAMSPNGTAIVAWEIDDPGYDAEIQAKFRTPGGTWVSGGTLTPGDDCPPMGCGDWNDQPAVAIDSTGDAIVAWHHYGGSYGGALPAGAETVQGRFAPAGGGFLDIQRISAIPASGLHADHPQIAIDGTGSALAVWNLTYANEPDDNVVQGRVRAAGGALGSVQNLSAVGGAGGEPSLWPHVAMNASGYALAVWQIVRVGCSCLGIEARAHWPGVWTPIQGLSPPATEIRPAVAVDSRGNALATWQGDPGNVTKAAASPNPPPTITITSPVDGATYAPNQAVNADYTCSDRAGETGIATCVGGVPDGAPIDTATPGSHAFTVTATDHAGNSASKTVYYTVS